MPQARFSSASPSQALSGQERDLGIAWIVHSTYFLVVDKPQLSPSSSQETAMCGACMVATILRTAPDLLASSAGHCALSPVPPSAPNTCKMKKPRWMCAEQGIQIMPNQCQDKPWIPKKVKLCLKSYHSHNTTLMFWQTPLTTLSRCWARKFLPLLPLARVASGPWGGIRARSEKRIMSWDWWIIVKKDDDCLTDWPLGGIVTWFWTGFRPHTWRCSRSKETRPTSRRAQLHKRNIFSS